MYRRAAEDDERFKQYLEDWVFSVPDQEAYLEKVGTQSLLRIKASSTLGYAPGLDRR